jgi:hypothetical protein
MFLEQDAHLDVSFDKRERRIEARYRRDAVC